MAIASCVRQSQTAAKGMKNWFFWVSSRCKQPRQAVDLHRGGMALGLERLAQLAQQGGLERLAFQPIQQLGQQARGRARAGRPRPAPAGPGRPARLRTSPRSPARRSAAGAPVSKNAQPITARRADQREQERGGDPQPDAREDARRLAPVGQRDGVDARTGRPSPAAPGPPAGRAGDAARSWPRAARAGRLGRRRCQQPGGQRLLAGAGPRRAEPLEERALAEQVEVGGIGMIDVQEAEPARPRSRPTDPPSGPIPLA